MWRARDSAIYRYQKETSHFGLAQSKQKMISENMSTEKFSNNLSINKRLIGVTSGELFDLTYQRVTQRRFLITYRNENRSMSVWMSNDDHDPTSYRLSLLYVKVGRGAPSSDAHLLSTIRCDMDLLQKGQMPICPNRAAHSRLKYWQANPFWRKKVLLFFLLVPASSL